MEETRNASAQIVQSLIKEHCDSSDELDLTRYYSFSNSVNLYKEFRNTANDPMASNELTSLFVRILSLFDRVESFSVGISSSRICQSCETFIKNTSYYKTNIGASGLEPKKFIMAILRFLSCTITELDKKHIENNISAATSSQSQELLIRTFPFMPLINCRRSTIPNDMDLYYSKDVNTGNGVWRMDDSNFRRKIVNLERSFFTSSPILPKV